MSMLVAEPNLVYQLLEEVSLKLRPENRLAVIPKPACTTALSRGAFKKMYFWVPLLDS